MKRYRVCAALGIAAWVLICPACADAGFFSGQSVLSALHRFTAALPFPLLECIGIAALSWTLVRAAMFAVATLKQRSIRPLRRFIAGLAAASLTLMLPVAVLWYPGYWIDPPWPEIATDAAQIRQLRAELLLAMNADDDAMLLDKILADAPCVAGMAWARVKPARYPEWMCVAGLRGLFAPWTGEVIVNPNTDSGLIPFTAVHELMHLAGIADEGRANIAAWQHCIRYGGTFADAARRYALTLLCQSVPERATRMGRMTSDYHGLIGWLIAHPESR